ncbi:hypothetical protein J6590_086640 [Homalodisca vitripennis]|nr:hypothetical protein J6590_086640 [Homalodisca vitripennis]
MFQDIQEFLDGAYNGAVLFSFGSIVRLSSLPPPTVRKFLNVISNMPQRFIMKYEEELPDAPPNVMYMKWLPQSDILAHPNVRAFVSHGGQASTMEAVYFAKPLVAVPFFGDQYHNANNVVCSGAAILLDIDNFSQADFLRALSAVLNDSWLRSDKYRGSVTDKKYCTHETDVILHYIYLKSKALPDK